MVEVELTTVFAEFALQFPGRRGRSIRPVSGRFVAAVCPSIESIVDRAPQVGVVLDTEGESALEALHSSRTRAF